MDLELRAWLTSDHDIISALKLRRNLKNLLKLGGLHLFKLMITAQIELYLGCKRQIDGGRF